jgi:MSHA biogenesis protein MshP
MSTAMHKQRGVSLVTAIFLLVVLAGLSVGIVTVVTTQQSGAALDVMGTRAYLAARAGVEWGLYQQLRSKTLCPAAGFTTTSSFALPAGSTLSKFSVSVTCTTTVSGTIARYRLRSVSCNQPAAGNVCPNPSNSPDYVQRVIQVDFGD